MSLKTKRLLPLPATALVAAGLAACGGSHAAGVQLAPSAGGTAAAVTAAPTTPTTTTTATTPTPSAGPLSTEPHVTPPSGAPPKSLVVKDLIKGNGTVAGKNSNVVVNYVGELYTTGKVFSASWSSHQTFAAGLGTNSDVIQGWDNGIPGMRVGGRRELIIPPSLAYGSHATSGIPANSTLIFVIDLLAVK
jgi:peptidylprolyl isomerase